MGTTEGSNRDEVFEAGPVTEKMNSLRITKTPIAGLLVVDLPLRGDNRGWFKEHWQREKMLALGLPDFGPVQQNISFNAQMGTTRGIHAEPWDKYVSVANGRAFGAWVDLREGNAYGTKFTIELTPARAVFVPRGVANAFQTLEPDTSYMYLVNEHWSESAEYTFLNLSDPTVAIDWPLPLESATVSDKDLSHPFLPDVTPMGSRETVVLGANGQLGRALRKLLPVSSTRFLTRIEMDLSNPESIENYDWENVGTIINAAAYTAVDAAETTEGRSLAWQVNAVAVEKLARIARSRRATLVSISSDYVFDGSQASYSEEGAIAPLGAYGQSKAAGDIAASLAPKHFIIRTSWVVGEGKNFVRTMKQLAESGANPRVICDQTGRLTFTSDLAEGIIHLLNSDAPYGTYNLTCSGASSTWFDIAQKTFELTGHDPGRVSPVASVDYLEDVQSAGKPYATRPQSSMLELGRIRSTGFTPRPWINALENYLCETSSKPAPELNEGRMQP